MDVSNQPPALSSRLASEQSLETVRALHQTIVSLRAALEQSRAELFELRVKARSSADTKLFADTIEKLSLENHILRERVLSSGTTVEVSDFPGGSLKIETGMSLNGHMERTDDACKNVDEADGQDANTDDSLAVESETQEIKVVEMNEESHVLEGIDQIEESGSEVKSPPGESESPQENRLENPLAGVPESEIICKTSEAPEEPKEAQAEINGLPANTSQESDNESEELDDIELIFTTEETKELGVLQEDLVSITDTENWTAANGEPSPTITVEKSTQFDEESTGLRMPFPSSWAHTVVVETDISKCGIIDENEVPRASALRRNTLPSPVPYRPIIHKELLTASKSPSHGIKFPSSRSPRSNGSEPKRSPMRPILVERNSSPKRESEAQTDITALPAHWKSESYLAHKVSHQFTTLPSKFTLPTRQAIHSRPSLKICDRNQDARRILLSDINFTSMVPELSRSADHLALESGGVPPGGQNITSGSSVAGLYRNYPRAFSYMKNPDVMGPCLVSPGYQHAREYGRFMWSPCECGAQGKWEYPPRYQSSQSSVSSPPPHDLDPKRRHSMKPSTSSLDMCRHGRLVHRSMSSTSWQSEPASPTHCRLYGRTRSVPLSASYTQSRAKFSSSAISCGLRGSVGGSQGPGLARARSKVTFQDSFLRRSGRGGQSLPDLRVSDCHGDSGESTDSLIDEAEEYLRRSIDSIITGTDLSRISKRRMPRRHSDPDPVREFITPKSAQPFLPKAAGDLKVDHLVKVITSEGRVTMGRVRYVGAIVGLTDPHVGLELPNGGGDSDGNFRGRRYFECDSGHSIFVPFKKVVMAWRP